MGISDKLKAAGYSEKVSTAGDRPIMVGVYRALFVDYKDEPNGQYGSQLMAKFKAVEKLSGTDINPKSAFPEFTEYYKTDDKGILSKRNGLAKLLDGFFSVGLNVDRSSEDKLIESLDGLKGSAEVYIKAYAKDAQVNVGTDAEPKWEKDATKPPKQAFLFMTAKNAEKEAKKQIKKAGHPL